PGAGIRSAWTCAAAIIESAHAGDMWPVRNRNRMTRASARDGAWPEPARELRRSARRLVSRALPRPDAKARGAVARELRGRRSPRRRAARAPAPGADAPRAVIRLRHAARRH